VLLDVIKVFYLPMMYNRVALKEY